MTRLNAGETARTHSTTNRTTTELAEFVGILLGDGCIGIYKCRKKNGEHKQYRVKITLDSRNEEYAEYVAGLFSAVLGFKPLIRKRRGENTCDILTFRRDAVFFLLNEVHLKLSPKWNRAKIPRTFMNRAFGARVLRGYFDTDGATIIYNNNGTVYPRLEMKIMPSPMQKQLQTLLKKLGFKFTARRLEKGKLLVRLNGKQQVERWFSIVGTKNPVHSKKNLRFCLGNRVNPSV
ncbi:MAG: LAGLIDADG family homing endonuclease [Candidatus Micrarchaeota archaeon]